MLRTIFSFVVLPPESAAAVRGLQHQTPVQLLIRKDKISGYFLCGVPLPGIEIFILKFIIGELQNPVSVSVDRICCICRNGSIVYEISLVDLEENVPGNAPLANFHLIFSFVRRRYVSEANLVRAIGPLLGYPHIILTIGLMICSRSSVIAF